MPESIAPATSIPVRRLGGASSWRILHYASLTLGLIGLLVLARGQWFYFDEWDIIWQPEGLRRLVEGHNGHWSLVPILVWSALQSTLGLGSYLPFMAVAILAHLVVAHLLWRIMLRLRVDPWIATTASAIVVFLGAGWENLTWAFQMGFVGAIAFGLGAVLIGLRDRLGGGGTAVVAALLLLGAATAGTALPFLPVVLVVVWQRHGWRKALIAVGVPAVVYLGWFALLAGPNPTSVYRASGVAASLIGIPQFASTMLVGSWSAATPVPGFGLVVLSGVAVGGLLLLRRSASDRIVWALAALAGAGVLFSLLTAYSRLALGLGSAVEPRYVYVVVVTFLPAAAALLTLLARTRAALVAVVALLGVVLVYNVGLLGGGASTGSARESSTHALISAALDLAQEHPDGVDPEAQPDRVYVPRTLEQLEILERDDGLQTIPYDTTTRLTALANVGVTVAPAASPDACLSPVADGEVVPASTELVLSSSDGGAMTVAVREGDTTSASREVDLPAGTSRITLAEPAELVVVDAPNGLIRCDG